MSSSAAPPALRCRTLREHALGGGVYKVTLRKAPAIVNGASTVAAKAGAAPSDVKVLKNPQHVPQDFQVVATIEVMEGCGSPCAIVTPRKGFEIKAEWPGAAEQAKTATLSVGIKRAIHCKTKLTVDKRVCVVFDSATMATVASTATATADLPSTLAILREEPLSTLFDGDGDGDADGTGKGRGRGRGRPRGSKNKKTTPQPQITVSPGVSVASGTTPSKSRSARGRGLCEEAGAAANAREETVSHQASRSAGGPSSLSAPSCAESDYSSNSGQGFTHEVSRQLPPAVMASSWGESHGLSGPSCTDEDANGRRAQPEQPDLSRLRPRSEGDGGEVRGSKEKVLPESGTRTGPAPRALTSDRAATVEQAPDNGDDTNKSAGSPTFGDDTRGGGRGITVPPGEIWRCARCTLLNDENQVRCGVCLTVRPREDYHLRRRRSEVPRFAEYQAARRIRQRNSAPARRSGPAGAVGAEGGDDGSSQDGAKEKTNGATKSTRRRTAGGRRNKVVRDGGAEVTSADRGDPLSSQQILLMFVEWASTPGPPCTLDTRALAEQAAWEVKGAQWPSREKCGAGSGSKSDRAPGTISPRKRKIAASRSVTEEGQGKRQRLPGNDGPEGGERVEGTEVGGELSDTDTDVDMDQAKGESSETALSEALAKSSRDPPGQNGSGAAHPSLAAGCTTTPEGEEYQGEGFLGPEGDGNGEYHDRYRSADEDDGSGETELEFDGVGSVDY